MRAGDNSLEEVGGKVVSGASGEERHLGARMSAADFCARSAQANLCMELPSSQVRQDPRKYAYMLSVRTKSDDLPSEGRPESAQNRPKIVKIMSQMSAQNGSGDGEDVRCPHK